MGITARDVHIDRPLSNLVLGFEPHSTIVQDFLPIVDVRKQSDLYFKYDKGAFFRIPANNGTARAPKTKGRVVNFNVSSDSYYANNYALVDEISYETLANEDDPLKIKEKSARFVHDLLMLDMEDRVASQITSGSNLGSYAAVSSKWSDGTAGNSDPFGDIETAKESVRATTGYDPNYIIFGREVYNSLINHADIIDRIKYVQKGVVTRDLLASLFDVEVVLIGNAIKNTGEEGQSDSFSSVWGKNTIVGKFAPPNTDGRDPSLMYGMRWTNPMFGTPMAVEVWDDPDHSAFTNVRVGYYQDEKIAAPELGYLWTDCVA
jgi:hypothetical protein